jgi:DNA-binding MarR family transcriptional regulator
LPALIVRPRQCIRLLAIENTRHLSEMRFTVNEGHELAMWLRMAYLAFHRQVNAWMLEHGVTADQFVVLRVVAREPGLTQIEIVQRTASDPNTVAAILRLLERRRLIRRQAHARDGRARCVFLTAAGRKLQQRAYQESEPLRAALGECTTASGRAQNEQFLQRVHKVFSAPIAGANGRPPGRLPKRKAGKLRRGPRIKDN